MFSEFIDISRSLYEGMPVYPGDTPYSKRQLLGIEKGEVCNLSSFTVSMHGGTHVDAPLHFIDQGMTIDQVELGRFWGKARVLEFETSQPLDADALAQYVVGAGERILINIRSNETGNERDGAGTAHIGLQLSAADYLVRQGVDLVGINCDSIESGWNGKYEVHRRLLGAGIPILENLILTGVQPGEYCLVCFPLKIREGEASPVRAVLMR